jgi:hypothetical protein
MAGSLYICLELVERMITFCEMEDRLEKEYVAIYFKVPFRRSSEMTSENVETLTGMACPPVHDFPSTSQALYISANLMRIICSDLFIAEPENNSVSIVTKLTG